MVILIKLRFSLLSITLHVSSHLQKDLNYAALTRNGKEELSHTR